MIAHFEYLKVCHKEDDKKLFSHKNQAGQEKVGLSHGKAGIH